MVAEARDQRPSQPVRATAPPFAANPGRSDQGDPRRPQPGLLLHAGRRARSGGVWLERGLKLCEALWFGEHLKFFELYGYLGINALRRGEIENCLECVGPSSCIFPIADEAVHTQQAGSREAVKQFTAYLRVARRPAGPLAAEHRLHDAGRVSRRGPAAIPDPARRIPLEARRGAVRERRARGRPRRRGARTWPAAASSTTSTATACPTCSPPRSMSTGGLAVRQPRRRHLRGPLGGGGPGHQIYALNLARADYDNDGNPTCCCCAVPGRSRRGSRCCGTRAAASSRT